MGDRAFVLRSNPNPIQDMKIIEVLQVFRSLLFVLVCRLVCYLVKAWVQNTIYTCFISWVGGSGKQISDDIFVSGWEQEIILKVGLTKSFCFVHLLIT